MTHAQDVWILSVPARSLGEAEALKAWMEAVCDAAPVEIELPPPSPTWIESYFEDRTSAELVRQAMLSRFPEVEGGIRHCGTRDWTTFWRHHFHPMEIGEGLRIVPEWMRDEVEADDREVILINPGLSFGTGNHFTTRFCLEMLDRMEREGTRPERMLDAGCGSAILSIAARKFGWGEVLAVDHDAFSIDQAGENLDLNGVTEGVELRRMDLTREWPEGTFPLVVANLYGGLLMELAGRLVRSCAGTLVLSGIRAVEAEAVSSVVAQLGVHERLSEADHEWCGMVFDCSGG